MSLKKTIKKAKITIGTLDRVDFPEFDLLNIPCKIDTGAETSAIHCHKIKLLEKEGQEVVAFKLLDPRHEAYHDKEFQTKDFEERKIRSSSGHAEFRYVIKTVVRLFGNEYQTEFTLADRESMKYPVLLGKKLLAGNFLVDVAKKNLSFKQKQKPANPADL